MCRFPSDMYMYMYMYMYIHVCTVHVHVHTLYALYMYIHKFVQFESGLKHAIAPRLMTKLKGILAIMTEIPE